MNFFKIPGKIFLLSIMALLVLSVAGCGGGSNSSAGNNQDSGSGDSGSSQDISGSIQIQGSDTMVNLGQAIAEYYMNNVNTGASLAVTGGGSGTGIAAMINDNTDIAQSSRAMKQEELDNAEENGVIAYEFVIAQDGMAIVVHDSNPIEELSVQQLKDIFTGVITNWSELGWNEGGAISVYSRQSNSGTYVYFNENIMHGEDWAEVTLFMPGSAAIADGIATDTAGIGYFGVGYVKEEGNTVLLISRGEGEPAVTPLDPENVNTGAYPIARPLFFYTNGVPAGLVKDFLEWVLSEEGQEVIIGTGFYRITPEYESINNEVFNEMASR